MVLIFIDKKALCVFYFIVFIFSSGKLLTLNILRCDDGSLHILFLSFKSSLTFLNAAFTVWSADTLREI